MGNDPHDDFQRRLERIRDSRSATGSRSWRMGRHGLLFWLVRAPLGAVLILLLLKTVTYATLGSAEYTRRIEDLEQGGQPARILAIILSPDMISGPYGELLGQFLRR